VSWSKRSAPSSVGTSWLEGELTKRASHAAQKGLVESKDSWGPHRLEQRMRLPRSRVEEAERLDAAIAKTIRRLKLAPKPAARPNFD
jgi:hypothetical protein